MSEYQILLDTWEGQNISDFATLKAGGVAGVFIRLNDMNGGHHMDTGFNSQWDGAGAAGMLRAPYFVYNPWVNGQANFDWLNAHAPAGIKLIAADIEVSYSGISRSQYASDVAKFYGLARSKWNVVLYTGQWFLDKLSSWPMADYWWAQYMNVMYPGGAQTWTFDQLRYIMDTLTVPSNASSIPGTLKLWQCSGDRIILPGTGGHPTDINLFRGTLADLESWMGGQATPPPPPGGQMLYGKVNVTLNVRNGAGATYTIIGSLLNGDLVTASETRLVKNAAGIDVAWWHLTDATRNGQPVTLADGITIKARAEGAGDVWASSGNGGYIMAVEPPPSGEPVLTHTIEVFSDGSLRIDGVPV